MFSQFESFYQLLFQRDWNSFKFEFSLFLFLFFKYLAFKELEFAFKVKSVLQAKGRQCNMLSHCNEKTATEFALWGPGVLLVPLLLREGTLWWQNWLFQKKKASQSMELLYCCPLFSCFWGLSSKRELTSTSAFIIWVCVSLRKWQGWRVYVLSECQDDNVCSDWKDKIHNREQLNEEKEQMRPRGKWFSNWPCFIATLFMTSWWRYLSTQKCWCF